MIDYHDGIITGIDCFPQQHYCVSCGEDGKIRIWDYANAGRLDPLVSKLDLREKLTCITCNLSSNLIAAGTEEGHLVIVEAHNVQKPSIISILKIHTAKITTVKFHPNGKLLATGSSDFNVGLIDSSSQDFVIKGYVPLPGRVNDIVWDAFRESVDNNPSLFIAVDHDHGDLFRVTVPLEGAPTLVYDNQQVQKSLLKLQWTPLAIAVDPRSNERSKQLVFAVTTDKLLKRYIVPEKSQDPDYMDDSDIAPPKDEFQGHEKLSSAASISVSYDKKWLATGGADGLIVRSLQNIQEMSKLRGHKINTFQKGLTVTVSFSFDSHYILSSGGDQIFCWALPKTSLKPSVDFVAEAFPNLHSKEILIYPTQTILEEKQKEEKEKEEQLHERTKAKYRNEIQSVKTQVLDILDENEKATQYEKLEPAELVIDTEEKERLVDEGEKQVQELKQKIKEENTLRDLMVERIKKECWNPLEEQSVILKAFKRKIEVPNYAIRSRNPKQVSLIKKLKLLRRVELREIRTRLSNAPVVLRNPNLVGAGLPFYGSIKAVELNLVQYKFDEITGALKPPLPEVTTLIARLGNEEQKQLPELLYHPLDLYTNQRRVTQIYLLQHIVFELRKAFNKQISVALDEKLNEIQKIHVKAARIREITEEAVGGTPEIFDPEPEECEIFDSVLKVQESEIQAVKFVPEEQKQEKFRKLHSSNSSGVRSDNLAQRGVKSILGALSLDNKFGNSGDEEIIKPAHLNKPENQMTEDEVKELREYEKKVQAAEEEKEKRAKAMENEVKKLQSQIAETCNSFDDLVQKLVSVKVDTDQLISEQELKIIALAQALLEDEQAEIKEQSLITELAKLKQEKIKSTTRLTEFKRALDQFKQQVAALANEDKVLENYIKKELENSYDMYAEALLKLFKKRTSKPAAPIPPPTNPNPGEGNILKRDPSGILSESGSYSEVNKSSGIIPIHTSADPYAEIDNQIQKGTVAAQLEIPLERPDAIDDARWYKFLEMRQAKIEKETDLKRAVVTEKDMTKFCDSLAQKDMNLTDKFESILRQLRDHREQRVLKAMNCEVLFKLKQGQVESEQSAVITDYSDSLLVNRQDIDKLNGVIRGLGNTKVAWLEDIKVSKKQKQKKQWENVKLDMMAEDLAERSKYFQLLRVTKQLQEIIKGGQGESQHEELEKLVRRVTTSEESHQHKLQDKQKVVAKLRKQISVKFAENSELDQKLKQMGLSISEREKILKVQEDRKEAHATSNLSLQRVLKKTQLRDIIRAQDEEFKELTVHLTALRKRTLPFIKT